MTNNEERTRPLHTDATPSPMPDAPSDQRHEDLTRRLRLRLRFLAHVMSLEESDAFEKDSGYWEALEQLLEEAADDATLLNQAPYPIVEWRPGQSEDDFNKRMREHLARVDRRDNDDG